MCTAVPGIYPEWVFLVNAGGLTSNSWAQVCSAEVAEIHNHIASVELQDNNPNAALEQVKQALELGKVKNADGQEAYVPNILARAMSSTRYWHRNRLGEAGSATGNIV